MDEGFEHRPWGGYTVLADSDTHKVKRILVRPGQRLSYQVHRQRAEHWVVVAGAAQVTVAGDEVTILPGGSVDIPTGAAHRIRNPGTEDLEFIEVQLGDYFGEDDIVRLEDDYGRA